MSRQYTDSTLKFSNLKRTKWREIFKGACEVWEKPQELCNTLRATRAHYHSQVLKGCWGSGAGSWRMLGAVPCGWGHCPSVVTQGWTRHHFSPNSCQGPYGPNPIGARGQESLLATQPSLLGQEQCGATWRRAHARQLATKWPLSVWVKVGNSKQKHLALPLPSSYTKNLQAKMSIIGKVNWNIVYLLLSQPPAGQLTWKTKLAELKVRDQSSLKVKGNPLIYLQDHGAKFLIFVQLFSTGQDGGCLSCPWRTIQKEVRQAVLTDKLLNWRWEEKERCYQSQSRLIHCGPELDWIYFNSMFKSRAQAGMKNLKDTAVKTISQKA